MPYEIEIFFLQKSKVETITNYETKTYFAGVNWIIAEEYDGAGMSLSWPVRKNVIIK